MSEETDDATGFGSSPVVSIDRPITARAIASSFLAGAAGIVAMTPIAVGIPVWLGLFAIDPSGGFEFLVGAGGSEVLPVVFYALGGVVVLPLFFLVTATYLPPYDPRQLRGVTISVIFWPGFVIAFWPGRGPSTTALFLAVSLLGHLVYGLVLGVVYTRLTGLPEHEV